MWAYVKDVGRQFRPWTQQIDAHREDQRKLSIDKQAARTGQKIRMASVLEETDAEFTQQLDHMLQAGQPLQTEPGNVLLEIKNKGMMTPKFKENEILGMIARGLYVCVAVGDADAVPKAPHLSCRWHCKKQFQDLWQARSHFISNGFHRAEEKENALEDYEGDGGDVDAALPSQLEEAAVDFGVWGGPPVSAGSMDADAALPAPAPQPQDVSMWQPQDDSMDGAAALPSQPNEVIDLTDYQPGTISEINRMDNAAFALLYIQWLVYGQDRHMYGVDDWPRQVRELLAHCSLSSDLGSLNAALSELVIYPPYLWCKAAYWHELKESITPMWKRAGLI